MKRIKIFKAYFVLWTFIYFIAYSNKELFVEYFTSTLTFNIVIVTILGIGTFMLLKASKDISMLAGTFGVLMYKKGDISFYLRGIEKVLPTTIASKIKQRAKEQKLLFTQKEAEDILNWMDEKFSNQNKYNNFFIGTVLMIGLLGTFAGLLGSIGSMSGIVASLAGDNVDISKIMSGFSGPLSSMAVGFGSSLFGVISAIILSIKGYILNKSQAAVLEGVENWLNSKIVDGAADAAIVPKYDLAQRQVSFLDLFIQTINNLSKQIDHLSNSNTTLKKEIATLFENLYKKNEKDIKNLYLQNESLQKNLQELINLENLQKDILLSAQSNISLQTNLINQIKESSKIDQLQFAEALSIIHKELKTLIEQNQKDKQKEEELDFIKRHFELKKASV